MNEFFLVLTGAGISLVSSVAVTWLQFRYTRKTELRNATRTSTRQLTSLFITERDRPAGGTGDDGSSALAEAEMMSVAIADRRTRERVRHLTRLLRELDLPELQELSGLHPERARNILCDHALEVLGAHFRGERVPQLPQSVQKMLDVEDEALSIHAGASKPVDAEPAPAASRPTRRSARSASGKSEKSQKGGSQQSDQQPQES